MAKVKGTILQGLIDSTPLYNDIIAWRMASKGTTTRLDPVLNQIMDSPPSFGRLGDYNFAYWRTGVFMVDRAGFLATIANQTKTS